MVLVARRGWRTDWDGCNFGASGWADLSIPTRWRTDCGVELVAEIKGSERPGEFVVLGAAFGFVDWAPVRWKRMQYALVVDALRTIKASDRSRGGRFAHLFAGRNRG